MYTRENWSEYITARDAGELCEVDEDIFDYFLEVLPPVYMFRSAKLPGGEQIHADYGFAEGAETITAFWRKGGKFFCQRTEEMNRC